MENFNYFAPTELLFGRGVARRVGEFACRYGKKALIVTGTSTHSVYQTVCDSLTEAGLVFTRYDGVTPNPTTETVAAGARVAREFGAELVIGLGGGSAMDTAKAIAVEATHPGTCWDYLHFTAGPTECTLPIFCIGTTAGTGSQVTPCAVITKTETQDKSAIWHRNIFPKVAFIDPEATVSQPSALTAQTGFDAFCHNFEACISNNSHAFVETLALDAIKRIVEFLPRAVKDGNDLEAREQLAYADTVGGLCISSAGVTLPHGLGMQIGGHCPHVSHGQALAVQYPTFMRFTQASAVQKFAAVGRIFSPTLCEVSDEFAAERCCELMDEFLKKIDLWIDFTSLGVTDDQIRAIAACGQVLGDYQNNPRIASLDEMLQLLMDCRHR